MTGASFVTSLERISLDEARRALTDAPHWANATDERGTTALAAAVKSDRAELVELLLAAGASPDTLNVVDRPAYAFVRSEAVAAAFSAHGVDWASEAGTTALYLSLDRPLSLTEWLLARGAPVDLAVAKRCAFREPQLTRILPHLPLGDRPGLWAAALGIDSDGSLPDEQECLRRVALLLRLKLDPNVGQALFDAAADNRADVVRLLVRGGAQPNRADPHGDLPIVVAATEQAYDAVAALLECGADPELAETALSPLSERDPRLAAVLA